MRKNRPKRKRARSKARPEPQAIRCRALLVVDSSRIRRKALTDCKRARTTYEKAEQELEIYESRDKPAFMRWYRFELGPRIGEVKELYDRIEGLRAHMHRLARFASMKRCGLHEAARLYDQSIERFEDMERVCEIRFQRQQERRRRQEEQEQKELLDDLLQAMRVYFRYRAPEIKRNLKRGAARAGILDDLLYLFSMESGYDPVSCLMAVGTPGGEELIKEFGLEGALDFEDDMEPDEKDEDDEDLEDVFDEFFGSAGNSGNPRRTASRRTRDAQSDETRIKALYRELAFALHPDQSDSVSDSAKLELWHQVQEAVATRDLDRLEVLHAHMQLLAGELSPMTAVSRVMDLTVMFRSSRAAVRRRIRILRKTVDWGFHKLDEARRQRLKERLSRDLDEQLEDLRREHSDLRDTYQVQFAPRGKGRGTPASGPKSDEEDQPAFPGFA